LSETDVAALRDTEHYRIAKTTVKIQNQMFILSRDRSATISDDPDVYIPRFTSVLGFAASILPEMDEIARSWGYPLDPNEVDIALQNKLRENREETRRFVQAAGTLARVLGGRLTTGSNSNAIIDRYFATVQPSPNERPPSRHQQFVYDFLKAILLWLGSGLGALVEGFSSSSRHPRLPMSPDADVDAIDEVLIPYLLNLAGDDPIFDLDVSKFEKDERRVLHASEKAAVIAFARALKAPFADLTGAILPASGSSSENHVVQERKTALRHWAFKVGRGVLWNVAKDIRFSLVDRAFGGLGVAEAGVKDEEHALRTQQEDVDPLEEDPAVVDAEIVSRAWAQQSSDPSQGPRHSEDGEPTLSGEASDAAYEDGSEDEDMPTLASAESLTDEETDGHEEEESDEDEEGGEEDDDEEEESDGDFDPLEDDEDEEDDEDGEGLSRTRSGHILWRSDFDRSYIRQRVEADVPCVPHTKIYKGHCNVKTVKDVNYFGLQDEYVVSGSDCGHVFIWDRKTSQLLNILEGDGEVVNVVQGHPYEPTMAVSGIDHTIKIFSPDAHEQRNARKGIGVHSGDPGLSSLGFGLRRRTRLHHTEPPVPRAPSQESEDMDNDSDDDERATSHGLSSRKRMHQEYEITSHNDMERKGGREDAFITVGALSMLQINLLIWEHWRVYYD
jgi:nuclear receptor interaction protein